MDQGLKDGQRVPLTFAQSSPFCPRKGWDLDGWPTQPAGCVGRWLCAIPALARLPVFSLHSCVLCGALAVGLAILAMVITDTKHPPAAGLALGLVLNEACDGRVLAVVLIGIVSLSLAKEVLKPLLIDLL